MISFNLLAALT